jgi:tripartite-type tricarboxylate transporter receptor subunit TctC
MKHQKLWLVKAVSLLCALSILIALPAAVLAADAYPSRVVRLIIPAAAGGSSDQIGRQIAAKLSDRFGKSVVLDFRSGGGGIIGTEMAAKAEADGYTLLLATGTHSTQPALQKLPYDPVRSFTPIARLGSGPFALVIHPSVPVKSVKELIALAKQKPGQLLFVSSGVGANPHMSTELFKMMAGIDIKIVQFKGGGPAIVDLLGGHSQAFLSSIHQVLQHIKSGKVKVLGTSGVKRSVILPDVPTIAEAGVPGYEATQWFGILAPAGTPAPIVNRLSKEIESILASDEVERQFLNEGVEADYVSPAEFGPMIEKEIAKWTKVVQEAKIKLE